MTCPRRLRYAASAGLAMLAVSFGAGAGAGATRAAQPLRLAAARTPRFVVGLYNASGTYPQVAGGGRKLRAVNAGLRGALAADQRRYVSGIGDPHDVGAECGGIYATSIDPRLVSASTVVVSALLPAVELYPCGNDGHGW